MYIYVFVYIYIYIYIYTLYIYRCICVCVCVCVCVSDGDLREGHAGTHSRVYGVCALRRTTCFTPSTTTQNTTRAVLLLPLFWT